LEADEALSRKGVALVNWQLIDLDTPKDTLLLVRSPNGVSVAEYDTANAAWYTYADGDLAADGCGDLIRPNPTHWMLIPEFGGNR
jgi:hypothetical protein